MSTVALPHRVLELLAKLSRQIHETHIRAGAHAKATHERFNVFTTLLSEADEVRLHTRFLHCLLDPNGLHDCGPVFLNLFFATLNEIPGLDHKDMKVCLTVPASGQHWKVTKEQSRPPHGQIDLLLERPGFGIAIENKIHAREQDRQLAAYSDYLKHQHGASWRMIYLTVDGKKSETHEDNPYLRISYRDHILVWLEKCLRETYHVIPVNQLLQQYRKVVRTITGKTIETSAMKPITDFILQNPDIIRYRQQIVDSVNEARADFLDRLVDGVSRELRNHGFKTSFRENHSGGRFGLDRYGDMLLFPPNAAFIDAPFVFCLEHDSDLQKILVGITTHLVRDRPGPQDANLYQRMDAILVADSQARAYHKDKGNTAWPTGWHDILPADDAAFAELIKTPLPDTVAKVSEAVLYHVELVERVYRDAKQSGVSAQ